MDELKTDRKSTILVLFTLLEVIMLPKLQILGRFKFMYFFIAFWFLNYCLSPRYIILKAYINHRSLARRIINLILILAVLGILGELTMLMFTDKTPSLNFIETEFIYFVMACSVGIGYCEYRFNKKLLLWLLYIYIGINIFVSLIGSNIPSFFLNFWSSYREVGYRNHGIIGNANASLAIMNVIFLCIVVLAYKNKIIISGIHLGLVTILPLLCNMFINSRGEFLQTIILEIIFFYILLRQSNNLTKSILKILIIVASLIIMYIFVFDYLYYNYPRIQTSLERLKTIKDIFYIDSNKTSETILRPFYAFDDFINRFIKSPIWGTGFSGGNNFPFIRDGISYHNDWFGMLINGGIIGFGIWICFVTIAVKLGGIVMVLPFVTTAISNTFILSNACMMTYFLLLGMLIHYDEVEKMNKNLKKSP